MFTGNCNIDSELWCLQETVMCDVYRDFVVSTGNRDVYRSTGNCDVCRDQ